MTHIKRITINILGLSLFFCFIQMTMDKTLSRKMESTPTDTGKYEIFNLSYLYAGLGSGMGSMQPTFIVKGKNYVYTREQNSYYGKQDKKTERISDGTLRNSSIDSILDIVKNIKDTFVYKTNVGVMSGGVHHISVEYEKTKVTFQLHNAYDSTAQKIINILNTNIPANKQRLWLFDFPIEK